ncbi:hypothetical protein [Dysgonomonas sp. 520]|uniref:hypothetical protein n=1 Tax=Dysgonomonas sp. 520 TaxID=2302931 RepID=UPI0013CF7DD4|nr:hypothetical protein [Dysgonomonas sp. 520]NDW10793.1 hypothetical protein [Dysgonomonas sp. 520]
MEYGGLEYDYFIIQAGAGENIPTLTNGNDKNRMALKFLSKKEPLAIDKPLPLRYGLSIPDNPVVADCYSLPQTVFSKRIVDVLSTMNIEGVQFIPAVINSDKGEQFDDYFIVHSYNWKSIFDGENSIYTLNSFTDRWDKIGRIYLDSRSIAAIPLNERLLFTTEETSRIQLYHKSLVDAIMPLNPVGVRFVPVEGWSDNDRSRL